MIKLDGLTAFLAVAEAGSISQAARRLALSKSVVSERLAELERTLGAQLLQRTTRKQSITADGEAFMVRARRILDEAAAATAEMAERRGELAGPLRLSAPVSFGTLHLGAALYPFLAAHPRIELTLDLDDRFVDLAADGYDAVIRHGPVRETWLTAVRLATSRRRLVASPDYLAAHGAPASLAALASHAGILYSNRPVDWRFRDGDRWRVANPRPALRVNNGLIMRDAALAGLGLTLLPTFLMHRELASGALVAIDLEHEAEGAEIYMAYGRDHGGSAKVRALAASLRRTFGTPPYWDLDGPAAP